MRLIPPLVDSLRAGVFFEVMQLGPSMCSSKREAACDRRVNLANSCIGYFVLGGIELSSYEGHEGFDDAITGRSITTKTMLCS